MVRQQEHNPESQGGTGGRTEEGAVFYDVIIQDERPLTPEEENNNHIFTSCLQPTTYLPHLPTYLPNNTTQLKTNQNQKQNKHTHTQTYKMKSPLYLTLLATIPTMMTTVRAAIGSRCAGLWDDGACICLDRNVCTGTYGGLALEGNPGSYPCPSDPGNVWGCYITSRCPGFGSNTACLWRNGCEFGTVLRGMAFFFSLFFLPFSPPPLYSFSVLFLLSSPFSLSLLFPFSLSGGVPESKVIRGSLLTSV